MSAFGGSANRLVAILLGLGYFLILCVALVWWHLPPEMVLVLTVGGIALLVLSLRPYVGVQAFVIVLFVENAFGAGEGLTPMKFMGALVLAGWLLNMAIRRATGIRMRGFVLTILLFLAWNFVCMAYSLNEEAAVARTFTYLQLGLAAMMFASVVDTPARLRGVYWAFVIGSTISTLVAVVEYYLGITDVAVGFIGNKNLLATYLNVAIVLASLLVQETRHGGKRALLVAILPILFLGLALTFSRGGLIVLGPTMLLVWYRVARQKRLTMLVGSIGMLCLITYILPLTFWERAETIVPAIRKQQDTFGTRVHLWQVAMRMVEDRPIFGVGPGNFVSAFPRYAKGGEMIWIAYATHNSYVGVAAESGLVGAALFLLMCGLGLREARRGVVAGRRSGRSDVEIVAQAAGVSLLAIVLTGLSGNIEAHKILWMLFGLCMAAGGIGQRLPVGQLQAPAEGAATVPLEGLPPWALARPRQ
jgi:O-antigen ligase